MSRDEQLLARRADGVLLSPGVGVFRAHVTPGDELQAGMRLGALLVLGKRQAVYAPAETRGVVTEVVPVQTVDYDTVLLHFAGEREARVRDAGVARNTGLAYLAPMSGRFYQRPSPGEAPFVAAGETLADGQTIGLLEVMKTFHRLTYPSAGLPSGARVSRLLVRDGEEVEAGQPLLELANSAPSS